MAKTRLYTRRQVHQHKDELNPHPKMTESVRDFRKHFNHVCDKNELWCKTHKAAVDRWGKDRAMRRWRRVKQCNGDLDRVEGNKR